MHQSRVLMVVICGEKYDGVIGNVAVGGNQTTVKAMFAQLKAYKH